MAPNLEQDAPQNEALFIPLRTALLYAFFGGLWILFSDGALDLFGFSPEWQRVLQTYKGWGFVGVTALLLYLALRAQLRRLELEITERKSAQEHTRRVNRVYAVLSDVNQAIVRVRDIQEVYERVCRIAVEQGGFLAASVRLADPKTGVFTTAARSGMSALEAVDASLCGNNDSGNPVSGALRGGRHCIVHDLAEAAQNAEWAVDAAKLGCRVWAAFPLAVRGAPRGVFSLCAADPQFFDPDELRLLDELAVDISFAMEVAENEASRKALEEQFRQSQKLESIGRLAGGVAHDFNNVLNVIIGNADLALDALPADHPVRGDIEQIRESGNRAAALTRQLLAFSRKQMLRPEILDLNAVIAESGKMLRRLISEDVEIRFQSAPEPAHVKVDRAQMEQVLMNLAVNARDAMPRGGALTIAVRNESVDAQEARQRPPLTPGDYAVLAVTDTGTGMDQDVLDKIYEPFFTTKELGKGTGLGLPTVYGIIEQSGGHIVVDTEVDCGSTFHIYLPRVSAPAAPAAAPHAQRPAAGAGTILLVEDEAPIRTLTRRILERSGYSVLDAASGEAALAMVAAHTGSIDLVLTDVVMPGMSGRELAERLCEMRPGLRVLYMSGYTDDTIVRHGINHDPRKFIAKPFTSGDLAQRIRDVLDTPSAHS